MRAMARSGECWGAMAVSDHVQRAAAAAVSGGGERAAAAVSGGGERAAAAVSVGGERAAVEVSGGGERAAVAVSGGGERAPVAVSGGGERAGVEVSGGGEPAAVASSIEDELLDSLEYPCTERLRFRRLLAYLREHNCGKIYYLVRERLGVIFHVEDLVEQVEAGKLQEAYRYVRNFAPMAESSDEAELLASFLETLMAISKFANGDFMAGGIVCRWFKRLYRHPVLPKYPCFATLVVDFLFMRQQNVRNSFDWQLVRNKAAEMVKEMSYKAPELMDAAHYPRGRNNLYDVMPLRSSFHRRRQPKTTGQRQSADLAQFYLQMKKRLPSSGQAKCHDYSGVAMYKGETLIAVLDKALQAGKRIMSSQHVPLPPKYLSKGVFLLDVVLAHGSIPGWLRQKGYGLEQTSNQAMKRPMFQEPHGGTAHPGNDLKRPRTGI